MVFFTAQATIYGGDDLEEVATVSDPSIRELARSVAVQMRATSIIFGSPFRSRSLRNAMVCSHERFIDQPVLGTCTGFLVSETHLLTAGHCYLGGPMNPCAEMSWVFDYEADGAATQFQATSDQVYGCRRLVELSYRGDLDYAIVELDRPVVGRTPLRLSSSPRVSPLQTIFSIHSPRGLPLKYSTGFVRADDSQNSFLSAIDLMRGSSGAPIFDAVTREVLGIVAQGDHDYETQEAPEFCNAFKRCGEWECRGERSTRVYRVPVSWPSSEPRR